MFSAPVLYVGSTSIYGRLDGDQQWLAYQMEVETVEEVAMVLPLPVPPGCGDDAVRFHDLSGYPKLFGDLDRAFPPRWVVSRGGGPLPAGLPPRQTLKVHAVGDFDASFVPSPSDFDRLDPRFQLGEAVIGQLPQYGDWGFAVFQLRQEEVAGFFARLLGRGERYRRTVHPMAFRFPTRDPARVFFPTVHVHDGAVHDTARFDHTLYAQGAEAAEGWEAEEQPVRQVVDVERAGGLIDESPGLRRTLAGVLENRDVWL